MAEASTSGTCKPETVTPTPVLKMKRVNQTLYTAETACCSTRCIPVTHSQWRKAGERANKREKRARKLISKLGLDKIEGVNRVVIRTLDKFQFTITKPDVLKNPGTDHYVVFGDVKIEDLTEDGQQFDSDDSSDVSSDESSSEACEDEEVDTANEGEEETEEIMVMSDPGTSDSQDHNFDNITSAMQRLSLN